MLKAASLKALLILALFGLTAPTAARADSGVRNAFLFVGTVPILIGVFGVLGTSLFVEKDPEPKIENKTEKEKFQEKALADLKLNPQMLAAAEKATARRCSSLTSNDLSSRDTSRHPSPPYNRSQRP